MNPLLVATGIIGLLTVGLGAFGAHGLEDRLSMAAKGWWETATLYALVHASAALATALTARIAGIPNAKLLARAGAAFLIGCVVFSGSLYALALGAPNWFGAITPLGGLAFLAGWGLIISYGMKRA